MTVSPLIFLSAVPFLDLLQFQDGREGVDDENVWCLLSKHFIKYLIDGVGENDWMDKRVGLKFTSALRFVLPWGPLRVAVFTQRLAGRSTVAAPLFVTCSPPPPPQPPPTTTTHHPTIAFAFLTRPGQSDIKRKWRAMVWRWRRNPLWNTMGSDEEKSNQKRHDHMVRLPKGVGGTASLSFRGYFFSIPPSKPLPHRPLLHFDGGKGDTVIIWTLGKRTC